MLSLDSLCVSVEKSDWSAIWKLRPEKASRTWSRTYRVKARLFHRPNGIITRARTLTNSNTMTVEALTECVLTLLLPKPSFSTPIAVTVAHNTEVTPSSVSSTKTPSSLTKLTGDSTDVSSYDKTRLTNLVHHQMGQRLKPMCC